MDPLKRTCPRQHSSAVVAATVMIAACTYDDSLGAAPTSGTDGTSGTSETDTDITTSATVGTDTDETAGTGGGGGGCGSNYPDDPPYEVEFLQSMPDEGDDLLDPPLVHPPFQRLRVAADWDEACPDLMGLISPVLGTRNGLYVYYPGDPSTSDGWPDAGLPLVLFMHGQGGAIVSDDQTPEHFNPFLQALAAEGFVVVAATGGSSVDNRTTVLRCAAEWALTVWDERDRLIPCDVAAVGHSQGGGAVHNLLTYDDPPLDGLHVVVALAPAARSTGIGGVEPETEVISAERAASYLVIQGPNDQETADQGITNYDRMAPEDTEPVAGPDKVMLLPYDAGHWSFGGEPEADSVTRYGQTEVDRGRALASGYIPAFLRWKIYGEESQRQWFVEPSDYQADDAAFLDAIAGTAVLEDFWSALYDDPDYDVLGERPVVLSMFSQGTGDDGEVTRADTMYRTNAPATCGDSGHGAALPPAELAGALAEGDICIGMSEGDSAQHETHRLRIDWGPVAVDDGVRWPFPADVSTMAYLSMRGGKQQVTGGGEPTGPLTIAVEIQTEGMTDDGQPLPPATIAYDRLIRGSAMMHTARFPMADFCEVGIDPTQLTSVSILAEELQGGTSLLHLDSLEFADHPQDSGARCPQEAGFWACAATSTLAANEIACDTVPVSGACPSGHDTTTGVALPQQDFGSGLEDGWIVYTPPGWIADVDNPTQAELDGLETRCQSACEQEYAGSPHVSANCDASGAFSTPSLLTLEATGARQAIPPSLRDGSGIEPGESLSCGLLDTCCDDFDEDLCPAVARRVTYAQSELGRAQEWRAITGGKVFVLSLDDNTMSDASVSGTLGWTTCAEGNSADACPFYLGSGHVETTETLVIDMQCNGQMVQRQLDALEVDLVQPAFGIDFQGDKWKGMPAGSMVLASHVESGAFSFDFLDVNEESVVLETVNGFIKFHPSGGPKVFFDIWCDGELKPMEAVFSVNAAWNPGGPPTVSIDMPASVTCGTNVTLDADTTDPNSDQGAVRWEVDGVLIDSAVTQIQVNTTLEVRAIVRDARGATGTDIHTIDCSGP